MMATLSRDGADGGSAVHSEQRRFAIDESAHQEMILARTFERKRLILETRLRLLRSTRLRRRRNA